MPPVVYPASDTDTDTDSSTFSCSSMADTENPMNDPAPFVVVTVRFGPHAPGWPVPASLREKVMGYETAIRGDLLACRAAFMHTCKSAPAVSCKSAMPASSSVNIDTLLHDLGGTPDFYMTALTAPLEDDLDQVCTTLVGATLLARGGCLRPGNFSYYFSGGRFNMNFFSLEELVSDAFRCAVYFSAYAAEARAIVDAAAAVPAMVPAHDKRTRTHNSFCDETDLLDSYPNCGHCGLVFYCPTCGSDMCARWVASVVECVLVDAVDDDEICKGLVDAINMVMGSPFGTFATAQCAAKVCNQWGRGTGNVVPSAIKDVLGQWCTWRRSDIRAAWISAGVRAPLVYRTY